MSPMPEIGRDVVLSIQTQSGEYVPIDPPPRHVAVWGCTKLWNTPDDPGEMVPLVFGQSNFVPRRRDPDGPNRKARRIAAAKARSRR